MASSYNVLKRNLPGYPRLLDRIYDPPPLLHVKGEWRGWEERPWVAVVGARKASQWSLKKTRAIVAELVSAGFGIVSGLAYGIDGEAHKTCVENGGVTWGVLGSGIDRVYPVRHLALAKKMEERGGLLSEFPLGTTPRGAYFPQRNRIISGLSQAVIIVEAAMKSGSLITARFALEQGREVFTVTPPDETDVRYEGNRWLLEQGALPYESVEQLREEIKQLLEHGPQTNGWCGVSPAVGGSTPGGGARRRGHTVTGPVCLQLEPLLSHLIQPRSLDYLASQTKEPVPVLLPRLLELEAKGLVKKLPGALWQSR